MIERSIGDTLPTRPLISEAAADHNATLHSLGVVGAFGAETQPTPTDDAGTAAQQIRAGVADFNQHGVSPTLEVLAQGGVPADALPQYAARLRESVRHTATLGSTPLTEVARDFAVHRVEASRTLQTMRARRAASLLLNGRPEAQTAPADRRHTVSTSGLTGGRMRSRTRPAADMPAATPNQPTTGATAQRVEQPATSGVRRQPVDATVELRDLVPAVAAWEDEQPTARVVRFAVPGAAAPVAASRNTKRHRRDDLTETVSHRSVGSNDVTTNMRAVPTGPGNTHPPRSLRHFAQRLRAHLPSLHRSKGRHRAS